MTYAYNGLMILFFIRIILKLVNRSQHSFSEALEVLTWTVLVGLVIFIIPGLVYLIKPSWFMVNKEQTVEVNP